MCGRAYQLSTDEDLIARYIVSRRELPDVKPTHNLCPTQQTPVIFVEDGIRKIEYMRWGLVPTWAKDLASVSKYSLINAKAEEIADKVSFSIPFRRRRCIIPVTGFYEWKQTKPKRAFAIALKNETILSLAGIWEEWVSKETGEVVRSCAIITTAANELVRNIHDRMPVILDRDDEEEWLDPSLTDAKQLQKFLKPLPSDKMKCFEISSEVNSPRNNHAGLLEPLEGPPIERQ